MEGFGSALVPDFQQFYGLRLVEVARDWEPTEVLLLIQGLPEESRYMARLAGEQHGHAWSRMEWMILDLRNAVEALRTIKANEGRKKGTKAVKFRPWDHYPGAEAQKTVEKRRRRAHQLAKARELAQQSTF